MLKIRLRFEKTGQARYISHLDLMRTLQRAFARAGLPMAYSEGFNPHPYLSVARPLPVGVSSVCELLDMGLAQPEDLKTLPGRVSDVLPYGLRVLEAWEAVRKFQEIAWAEYKIVLNGDESFSLDMGETLSALFDGRPLPVTKKSKKGMVEIDAAPLVRSFAVAPTDDTKCVELRAVLAAGEVSLGPGHLLEAMLAAAGPDFTPWARAEMTRLSLTDAKAVAFC